MAWTLGGVRRRPQQHRFFIDRLTRQVRFLPLAEVALSNGYSCRRGEEPTAAVLRRLVGLKSIG
jgi:hypothetical protein